MILIQSDLIYICPCAAGFRGSLASVRAHRSHHYYPECNLPPQVEIPEQVLREKLTETESALTIEEELNEEAAEQDAITTAMQTVEPADEEPKARGGRSRGRNGRFTRDPDDDVPEPQPASGGRRTATKTATAAPSDAADGGGAAAGPVRGRVTGGNGSGPSQVKEALAFSVKCRLVYDAFCNWFDYKGTFNRFLEECLDDYWRRLGLDAAVVITRPVWLDQLQQPAAGERQAAGVVLSRQTATESRTATSEEAEGDAERT